MAKEFKKKLVHPTRKRLVDMVHTGEYKGSTLISKRDSTSINTNESKKNVTEILSSARKYLDSKSRCSSDHCISDGTYSNPDKKLIKITGYCAACLAKLETQIYTEGHWDLYQKYRITAMAILDGERLLENLSHAIQDVDDIVAGKYFTEEGKEEIWSSGQNPDILKQEIQKDMEIILSELGELRDRKTGYTLQLKELGYAYI